MNGNGYLNFIVEKLGRNIMSGSFIEFCKRYEKIFCYGTGDVAKEFAEFCKKYKIFIHSFIISDNQRKEKNFKYGPIVYLSDISLSEKDGIIIAVYDEGFITEIIEALTQKNLNDFFVLDMNESLYKKECLLNKKKYLNEVKRRKKYNIFDYKNIVKNFRFNPGEMLGYNQSYGHIKAIKKYLNMPLNYKLKANIEHGPYIDDIVVKKEIGQNQIFVFSNNRKEFLKKHYPEKQIYAIGPYIQYIKPIYNYGKIKKIKNKLGKTLIVFPTHSTYTTNVKYNKGALINEIERIRYKYNYKTVIICMYSFDILNGEDKFFKKLGYKIVSAGNASDFNFLDRLKFILLLGDMTMVNDFTTGLGYSLCLNRPVYFFYTDTQDYFLQIDQSEYYISPKYSNINYVRNELKKYFSNYNEKITQKQIEFVEKYWGKWNRRRVRK